MWGPAACVLCIALCTFVCQCASSMSNFKQLYGKVQLTSGENRALVQPYNHWLCLQPQYEGCQKWTTQLVQIQISRCNEPAEALHMKGFHLTKCTPVLEQKAGGTGKRCEDCRKHNLQELVWLQSAKNNISQVDSCKVLYHFIAIESDWYLCKARVNVRVRVLASSVKSSIPAAITSCRIGFVGCVWINSDEIMFLSEFVWTVTDMVYFCMTENLSDTVSPIATHSLLLQACLQVV